MTENPTPRLSPADQRLLAQLPPKQVDLVQRVMQHHPQLTVEEALEALYEAGM